MGKFTTEVQSGRVTGPRKRSFTPQKWEATFAATVESDAIDQDLYRAGLAIHEKLETVRANAKISTATDISATTKLRSLIAASNHNFFLVRRRTRDAIAEVGARLAEEAPEGFRLENLAGVRLALPGGADWLPDEVFESLVDGIETVLGLILREAPDLSGNPHFEQVDWGDIALEMNLGIFYKHAEDLWEDCLWNSYRFVDERNRKVFRARDTDIKRGYVTGHSRRMAMSIAFTAVATNSFRELTARGLLPNVRGVRTIERQGKRQVIRLTKLGGETEAIEHFTVMKSFAAEPYYSELLEERLPSLGGLTLSNLLEAWTVISGAAEIQVENVGRKFELGVAEDRPTHTWLHEYAPTLQIDALVEAVSLAAGIDLANGRKLVDFFTFRGENSQELWAQPLVPVGPNTVAPVFAAIVSPNLRRLVDVWMRQTDVSLARRGPAFEAHIRAATAESIRESKVLAGHAMSLAENYTFKPSGSQHQQIDLVFVIGNTVFVAEAKCILEPTDAKAVAMHRSTLEEAAEQTLIRAESIRQNRVAFAGDMRKFGANLEASFHVVPLVIVNTCTHVGVPISGVPVIDQFILGRFLDGEIEDVAVQGPDFAVQRRLRTVFYTSVAEAETTAERYFAAPPQLARFMEGVHERVVPLYAISEHDWEGEIHTLECTPNAPPPEEARP